ncbi:MAG: hypothetical protein JWL75_808 [Parcubacteria group bacterium]|nr:hypothetical protein [Parcubacteria group bacterium]
MIHYWEPKDYSDLEKAQSFSDLLPTALRILKRMPQPVAMVSGPITTGGRGSIEENLHLLSAAVQQAHEKGIHMFDQNPFEDKLQEAKAKIVYEGYCQPVLDEFYKPIFESGLVASMYFLPDWQTSTGARWERTECERLGIEIVDYPQEWLTELEK